MASVASSAIPGGCLCGAVRFSAVPAKQEMDVCHCGMCQRWSGGVFMAVPCAEITFADESALGVYPSSEWGERLFCKTCGSSLVWRMRGEPGGHAAVSLQSFDDKSPFVFAEEIFIDEKPDLYSFEGDRSRKTGAEIMAEFAAQQAGSE
ncbi:MULTISPECIES: GFA family protein [unclassified Chelatococcus]|uniref:GFA family protein n=1 Tax=unclassified Chelatococcus TaxID=2638111 RepID=UPI001BCFE54B|nr:MULTISPECIES: GFA family protein [unclassified Chelatococcus]CAH1673638.1 CENP-V/GFA domain-containing protein [Hyphomicrobiales bacterium]MBS7738739.1 GFA family protein [Chelatococcus sp. HY11]MBX3543143.1 GFA family protein [Chelatococcus sp.]MCO5076731.1 GFA family protein [Chelatococcus sp.]CAH1674118.1 CENP-V/GFA domain-containing protein [Hyphomicrobiales bacterium]